MTEKPHLLLGAGGHAKVLLDVLRLTEVPVLGVCDPDLAGRGENFWRGVPVLGNDDAVKHFAPDQVLLVNGVGQLPRKDARFRLHEYWSRLGYHFATLIHPTASRSSTTQLATGVQIMAGCIIQADTQIGEACIINTAATIDHDCSIGSHVHFAPGTTVCGGVTVGAHVFIGAGAVVSPGLRIGERAIIAAGSVVLRDVPAESFIAGLHR